MFTVLINEYKDLLKKEKIKWNLFEIIGFIVIVILLIVGTVFELFSKETIAAWFYFASMILLIIFFIILAKTHPKSAVEKQIEKARKHKKELLRILEKYRIDPKDNKKLESIIEMAEKEKNALNLQWFDFKDTSIYTLVVVPVITLIVNKMIAEEKMTDAKFWGNVGVILVICAIAGLLFWEARSFIESIKATSKYPYEMIIKDIKEIELFREDLLLENKKEI